MIVHCCDCNHYVAEPDADPAMGRCTLVLPPMILRWTGGDDANRTLPDSGCSLGSPRAEGEA